MSGPDPQTRVIEIVREAMADPAMPAAIAPRSEYETLEDLALHRSPELTIFAAAFAPGLGVGPHNHNMWSVVGVCSGQEENRFFERDGGGLRDVGVETVEGPGVLSNAADVIHAIRNPLDVPLLALHVYGGDLFGVPRSSWDPDTHEEAVFDWSRSVEN